MPVAQINFTGRKTIAGKDISIVLDDQASPVSFEVLRLALQDYSLPTTALVRLEAYRGPVRIPFDLGNVSNCELLGPTALPEFINPDRIRFRVKVTSVDQQTQGQILAEGSGFQADWKSGNTESLLPVRRVSDLDQEVYHLTFEEDGPVLLVNNRIEEWVEMTRDHPYFLSLVYPTAVRTVLNQIFQDKDVRDLESQDHWSSQWVGFAERHLKAGNHPDFDDDNNAEAIIDWIEGATANFAKQNQSYTRFQNEWTRGNHT